MVARRMCSFVKPSGEQCRANPLSDEDFCLWHSPNHTEEVAEAHILGGKRRRREQVLSAAYDFEGLDSIPKIRRLLEVAAGDVFGLEPSHNRARALCAVAREAIALFKAGELEERLATLEEEQRLAFRARVILAAAAGEGTASIARREGVRLNTVSTWRVRFAEKGMPGLEDEPRRGRPTVCGAAAERRILALLDEPPREGRGSWNGRLVAQALGDVPAHVVWEVLRKHGIQLQRRRSWCISTDPEFAPKAAEIVALYLDPPENAVVLSVDEKPHIQALERVQGYLRLRDGKAVRVG
jgi:transposase